MLADFDVTAQERENNAWNSEDHADPENRYRFFAEEPSGMLVQGILDVGEMFEVYGDVRVGASAESDEADPPEAQLITALRYGCAVVPAPEPNEGVYSSFLLDEQRIIGVRAVSKTV